MSITQGKLARRAALAGLIALGLTSAAFAQTTAPATGLGQSWPNAADVSASPNWHVYVFVRDGIKYIQVNDLNGTVHAAVATANGTTLPLPIGTDAAQVSASAMPATSSVAQTIYRDGTTTITAMPQSNGTTQFYVADLCEINPYGCGGPGIVRKPSSNP